MINVYVWWIVKLTLANNLVFSLVLIITTQFEFMSYPHARLQHINLVSPNFMLLCSFTQKNERSPHTRKKKKLGVSESFGQHNEIVVLGYVLLTFITFPLFPSYFFFFPSCCFFLPPLDTRGSPRAMNSLSTNVSRCDLVQVKVFRAWPRCKLLDEVGVS